MAGRAALYKRVSSQAQVKEGYSLAFQEEIMRDYCGRHGLTVVQVYEDGGRTGSNTDRAGLRSLALDAKHERFDTVLIFRVDRFSRDPVDLLYLVQELNRRHIKLTSVTEAVDASDPAGELMLTILGAIGKFVRANIIQNAMLGKRKRAEQGRYTGGRIPFGYRVDLDGFLVPNADAWGPGLTVAAVVPLVFDRCLTMAASGGGLREVTRWLDREGIPSPTRSPTGWSTTSLRQMLRNPVYTGDYVWNKTSQAMHGTQTARPADDWVTAPGAHEPLVARPVWDRVQSLLDSRPTVTRQRVGRLQDPLAGLLRCATCGAALVRRTHKRNRYAYYTCGSRYNPRRRREQTGCAFPYIRTTDLEAAVWSAVALLAADRRAIDRALAAETGSADGLMALEARRAALNANQARCDRDEARLLDLQLEQRFRPELLAEKLSSIRAQRMQAAAHLDRLDREREALLRARPYLCQGPDDVHRLLVDLLQEAHLPPAIRRKVLEAVVGAKGIGVHPDGRCEVMIRLPFPQSGGEIPDLVKTSTASCRQVPPGR